MAAILGLNGMFVSPFAGHSTTCGDKTETEQHPKQVSSPDVGTTSLPAPGEEASLFTASTGALLLAPDSPGITATLRGKSVLTYALNTFETSPLISQLVVVLAPGLLSWCKQLQRSEGWQKVQLISAPGHQRQDFVTAGLQALVPCRWFLIHDGTRPLVSSALLTAGLDTLMRARLVSELVAGVIAAVPLKETIKVTDSFGTVIATPERATLWALQTPQIFDWAIVSRLFSASQPEHQQLNIIPTCKQAGYELHLYPGSYDNILISTPFDLIFAEALLEAFG